MKKSDFLIVLVAAVLLGSCRKEYRCVCTDIHTGEHVYGGRFKTGKIFKKSAQESCKANNQIYKSDFAHCHLTN